jgi:acyl-coenzyme A synthetase/AMP-(fatty) acid ligase
MARVDEDGYYYIIGRKKRFVKIWGNRCNLDQIEQLVKPISTTCACAGVDDHITVFVTKDGLEKDIKDLLAAKTGLNPIAFAVKVIASIPVKDSGKIDYQLLQQML